MKVKNLSYNSVGTVDLEIEHPEYGWIPFTASPDDSEDNGRNIYAKAIAGDFGAISPYVSPPLRINTAADNKTEASLRLAATDWINQPDVYDPANKLHLTNRDAFLSYRSQIRAVAVNPTDGNLNWPTEPNAAWSE